MNSIRVHAESRDKFVGVLKNYNWGADPEKLKGLQNVPNVVQQGGRYREPNFCAIKDTLTQCDKIIANFVKFQNFNGCAEVKKLKD